MACYEKQIETVITNNSPKINKRTITSHLRHKTQLEIQVLVWDRQKDVAGCSI